MRCLIVLTCILACCGCNKIRTYRIDIVNESDCDIHKLVLEGRSTYEFELAIGESTGEQIIEFRGPRKNFLAENCFEYDILEFTFQDSTYVQESSCGGFCITPLSLSKDKLNCMSLIRLESTENCEIGFKLEW